MYDMTRVNAKGYFDEADTKEARNELRRQLSDQRTKDYASGAYERAGGVVDPLPVDAPQFLKDYHAYYKTSRGYHPRSLNSNEGWNITSSLPFLNLPLLSYLEEIESAVLIVHGEKAHSSYFGKDAFARLDQCKGDYQNANKNLLIVPGASHCDLYDQLDIIPFDDIEAFYCEHLGA